MAVACTSMVLRGDLLFTNHCGVDGVLVGSRYFLRGLISRYTPLPRCLGRYTTIGRFWSSPEIMTPLSNTMVSCYIGKFLVFGFFKSNRIEYFLKKSTFCTLPYRVIQSCKGIAKMLVYFVPRTRDLQSSKKQVKTITNSMIRPKRKFDFPAYRVPAMREVVDPVANAKTGVPELRPGEPRKGKWKKVGKWKKEWRRKKGKKENTWHENSTSD